MSFTERLHTWTGILKNIVIIGGISLAVLFAALSIWANISEGKSNLPSPPSIEKARYQFVIARYEIIYTDKYQAVADGEYLLHWYYAQSGDKYHLYKIDLPLDKKYVGDILITDRAKK